MNMRKTTFRCLALVLLAVTTSDAGFSTFEDQGLPANSYKNDTSSNLNVSSSGQFISGGNSFNNSYTYYSGYGGVWSGWAVSSMTNTSNPNGSVPDYNFEYTSVTGSGGNGSATYAVANTLGSGTDSFHPASSIANLAAGASPVSVQITNTAYDYYSMLYGDSFAHKFGAGDYLLLTINGYSSSNGTGSSVGEIDFYLANFLGTDSSQYYILNTWQTLNLGSLQGAQSLVFGLESSDNNAKYGINTPAEFALDNLVSVPAVVPEPSSFLLCSGGIAMVALIFRRGRLQTCSH